MYFRKEDTAELERRGHTPAGIATQIHQFTTDLRPVRLEHACTVGDGIVRFDAAESHRMLTVYERESARFTRMKFVPASGAASRMFKHLFGYTAGSVSHLAEEFILHFDRFPFVPELSELLRGKGIPLDELRQQNRWGEIFQYILGPEGLNYADAPKGLVAFHRYETSARTAFEEHLPEAMAYARNADGTCDIHFTLAPSHHGAVLDFLREKIEKDYPYEHFRISSSEQSLSSETIALDKDNRPARDENGDLIFRPAGHGALITNLEQCDADIIFIKNIDNVTTDTQREDTVFYKKVLGGVLVSLKTRIDHLLGQLERDEPGSLEDALDLIQHWFQPGMPIGLSRPQLRQYARLRLDRPLRVCGMVRNEGEPGGGPFWVRMEDGHLTKQIVEKSQVDPTDLNQARILSEATHFNPVDIVCAIRNRNGERYRLDQFIDYSTGFVSEKFHQGQVIRALELPGLWNGAMALWNTVFVEVPVSTFHPVKTVNDLLRPGHTV
jgi:hypothetical protein